MPFLPDWMGKDIFIDPLRTFLPFDNFAYPFEQMSAQKKNDSGKAERVLEELLNDGQISQPEYAQALATQKGPVWERALALGQQDDTEGRISPFDTVSMLLSPHAPLMWAHNIARGTPEQISPFLPITRSIKGVSALMGISPDTGGLNPEGAIRKGLGLPEFDQWDDYRIDRMLANLAATGDYSVEEVRIAMINRSGPAFAEARRRAGIEFGWGAMGSITGIPTKSYPVGEEILRELKDDYEAAWTRYENGDTNAINKFHEEHPEYEARLALFKSPEEKLRTFLIDTIWDKWHDMPKVNQDEVKNHLGDQFQSAFLQKETRSTESIPLNTLQYWVSIVGGTTPGKIELSDNQTPLELTDRDTAYRVQVFYDTRNRLFKYSDQVWPLQEDYYQLEEGAARRTFRRNHPILQQYWDWRRDFMQRNPDLATYLTDDPEQLPKYKSEQALQQAQAAQPQFTPEEWQAYLGPGLFRLLLDPEPLPPAGQQMLERLGLDENTARRQVLGQ